MKTVHRSPMRTGARDERAISANSPWIRTPRRSACSSRKEPVPAAHASFIAKSTTTPSSRLMNFESCPPISKIVSTDCPKNRRLMNEEPGLWGGVSSRGGAAPPDPPTPPGEGCRAVSRGGTPPPPVPQEDDVSGGKWGPGGERPLPLRGQLRGKEKGLPPRPLLRRPDLRGQQRGPHRPKMGISPREHDVLRGKTERVANRAHDPLVGEQPADERHPGNGVLSR